MYNVKINNYGNGQVQTRIYSHLIYTGDKEKPEKEELENNPFNNQPVKEVSDFDELEKEKERSLQTSMKRAKGKIYDYSRANEWDWFVTLTFAPDAVDRYNYSDCTKKLSKWLNNMKTDSETDFKYIVVPERHKDGAFHFHGLFAGCDSLGITDSGHCTKDGEKIYNIGRYKLGFTTATRVKQNEAVTKYITKYTTKDLMEHIKGKKKYWASRNLNLPTETVLSLEDVEKQSLHNELTSDGCLFYKSCMYEVGTVPHNVRYYEHMVDDQTEKRFIKRKVTQKSEGA